MRRDEEGTECPATLGEYRDMCVEIAGENNEAVRLIDRKIKASRLGRDEVVYASHKQMQDILYPLMD